MGRVSEKLVVDFFEWLRIKIYQKNYMWDFYDLMLNKEYYNILVNFAEEYLESEVGNIPLKKFLYQFIESDEFKDAFARHRRKHNEDCFNVETLCNCLCQMHLNEMVLNFLKKEYSCQGMEKDIVNLKICEIDAYELADFSKDLFSREMNGIEKREEKQRGLQFMNQIKGDLSTEVDFLEWLIRTKGTPIEFRKMPMRTFELLVEEFKNECGKNNNDIRNLIKTFKDTNMSTLTQKMTMVLSQNAMKRAKDLGYIYSRYQDKKVSFRCFLVPLKADTEEYIELLEKYWYDLNSLSGDYLDIYYSKADYGKSGYHIMDQMIHIPTELKTKAPVVVLWKDDLSMAKGIDIARLSNIDIFEVIQCIVNAIRTGKNLDEIVEEANHMSIKLRNQQNPINHNELVISGNAVVNGPVAVVNNGEMLSRINKETDSKEVLHEIGIAKEIINDFSELNTRQKELLNEILDDVKKSISENSLEQKETGKKRFREAIDLIGVGSKVIAAFSGLTNVLKFFGISLE